MTLHKATGNNSFCGPAALAIVTGKTTDDAARALRAVSGRRAIYGVQNWELVHGAKRLGVTLQPQWAFEYAGMRATLRPTLEKVVKRLHNGVYVVNVTGHYVVIKKEGWHTTVADNTHAPTALLKVPRLERKRVKRVWKVAA